MKPFNYPENFDPKRRYIIREKEVIKKFIEKGADINISDENGWSLLYHAVMSKSFEGVNFLLLHGNDINKQNQNLDTPLHLALKYKHIGMAGALLAKGASLEIQDKDGNTPLHLEILFHYLHILADIDASKINVNKLNNKNMSPLISLVNKTEITNYSNFLKSIRYLINHGDELLIKDDQGKNFFDYMEFHKSKLGFIGKEYIRTLDNKHDLNKNVQFFP